MRCLQTNHREPGCGIWTRSRIRQKTARPITQHVALIALEPPGRSQTRSVQPGIVEQKPALKAFPELESSAPFRSHHHLRMRLAHQVGTSITFGKMPLPKKHGAITAFSK